MSANLYHDASEYSKFNSSHQCFENSWACQMGGILGQIWNKRILWAKSSGSNLVYGSNQSSKIMGTIKSLGRNFLKELNIRFTYRNSEKKFCRVFKVKETWLPGRVCIQQHFISYYFKVFVNSTRSTNWTWRQ